MADAHFIIDKQTDGKTTETIIKKLDNPEMIEELARILKWSTYYRPELLIVRK